MHPRENPEARDSEGEGGNVDGTAWRLPIGCDARRIEFPPPITGKASARKQPSASENSTGDLPGFRSMELSESRLRRRASSEHAAVSGWGRAFLFGLLLVLVAGVIPIAGVHFYRSATGATQVASERTEAYASDRREVLMRLRAFHEADSPEAKAAFVAGGAEGVEEMRAYYEQHPPEPSMYVVDPTLEFFERSGIPAVRGTGRYSGAEPFVFEFSKRNGEWFLDWNRFKEADRLAHNG